jgi:hypothetical protein
VNREYYQHTLSSIVLIKEKAVRLNEVVKEETGIAGISFCDTNERGTSRVGQANV